MPTIYGNYDYAIARDLDDCGCAYVTQHDRELGQRSVAWTLAHTDQHAKDFMRELPFDLRFELGAQRVRLVHGSPRKVNEYLFEDKPARLYERLAGLADCDVLVFGHTHKPWIHEYGGVLFVNCGSVGKPKDGDPRARVRDPRDSTRTGWSGRRSSGSRTTPRRSLARSRRPACRGSTPRSWSPLRREGGAMKYVLFVCTHNAGRSQMAQALFERACPGDCRGESAGSDPARQVWPEVIEVMREVGIEISDRKPKRLTVEMQLHADWAVTMGCGDVCPYVPTRVDDWDIPDPAGRPVEEVREIRDMIDERVRELVGQHRRDPPGRDCAPLEARKAASAADRGVRRRPRARGDPRLRGPRPRRLRRRAGPQPHPDARAQADPRVPGRGALRDPRANGRLRHEQRSWHAGCSPSCSAPRSLPRS